MQWQLLSFANRDWSFPENKRLHLVKVRRVHLPGGWEEGLEWPLELANQIIYFGFARNELQHG